MFLSNLSQSEFERAIRRLEVEAGTAYRPDGTQAFTPVLGGRDHVPFPKLGEIDLSGTVFVHNHTELRRISPADVREAAMHQAAGIVATLPDGRTLRLMVSNCLDWPVEEIMDRQDRILRRATELFGYGHDSGEELDAKHDWMIR